MVDTERAEVIVMTYEVELVELAPQQVAVVCGKETVDGIPGFLGHAFGAVMQVLGQEHAAPAGPPFARYREIEGGFEIEAGFPAMGPVAARDDVEVAERAGGTAARTMHVGDYAGVGQAYAAVRTWLDDNGYAPSDAPWEEYLDEPSVAQPRTLVTFPCVRR